MEHKQLAASDRTPRTEPGGTAAPTAGSDVQAHEEPEDDDQEEEDDENNKSGENQQVKRKRGRPKRDPNALPIPSKVLPAKRKRYEESVIENVEDEDLETDIDLKGESKVDRFGRLTTPRIYAIKTIILPRHPEKLYMLTMDVAKFLGYRDSYTFFSKNPVFARINASDEDKEWLAEKGLIHTALKIRTVALLTARSVYRHFGHRVIQNGIPIRDDYLQGDRNESEILENFQFTSLNEPKVLSITPMEYDFDPDEVNRRSRLNTSGMVKAKYLVNPKWSVEADAPQFFEGDGEEPIDAPVVLKSAASAAEFNSRLRAQRQNLYYDFNTNLDLVPQLMQPCGYHIEIKEPIIKQRYTAKGPRPRQKEPSWIRIQDTDRQRSFPLAILPSQARYSIPLINKRFSEEESALAKIALAEIERKNAALRVKLTSISQDIVPEEDPLDFLEPIKDEFLLSDYLQTICGETTKNGGICRRPVINPGDKCTHHDPIKMGDCVFCAQVEIPEGKEATAYPIPDTLMLTCSSCRLRQHPQCVELNDPVVISKAQKYEWHCPNCKMCTLCNEAGDEAKMVFCDACDRGYHTYCIQPVLSSIPEGQWLCQQCAICVSCTRAAHTKGARRKLLQASSDTIWKHAVFASEFPKVIATYISTYCGECFKSYEADRYCPICMKVYAEDSSDLAMICCDICDRWVHVSCDPDLPDDALKTLEDPNAKFTCALCDDKKLTALIIKRKSRDPSFSFKVIHHKTHRLLAPPVL